MERDPAPAPCAAPASDAAVQFRYPLPLAAAYRAVRTAGDAQEQVGAVFAATEALFRFLALVNLSALLAHPAGRAPLAELAPTLAKKLTLGAWLQLLRESTKACAAAGAAFVRELPAARSALEADFALLIEGRNDVVHGKVKLGAAEARLEAARLEPVLRRVYHALGFLVDYRLGVPAGVRPLPEGGLRVRWLPLTGLEEPGEPMTLTATGTPFEGLPALLDPSGAALCLWPFARWSLSPTDGAEHLFLHAGADGFTHPRHRHAIRGVADPGDPGSDLQGGLAAALERAARIPLTTQLGLDEASRRRLADRGQADGQRVGGRYVVRGVLGRGGMGTVYRVHDERLRVDRAMKVLHPDLLRSSSEVERFHREGQLLAKLDDPRFVRVHDVSEDDDGRPFIVMDEVEGRTLQDLLDERGPLPVAEAVDLVARTLDALAVAHAQGIVHRDLKPGNVVRRADGSVCILDLGVAFNAARATRVTAAASAVGTLGYIPPEQAAGKPVPASDQWAAAAMLVALATGKSPADPAARAAFDAEVPAALRATVSRAYGPVATARHADVAAMAAALRAALAPVLLQSGTIEGLRAFHASVEQGLTRARDACAASRGLLHEGLTRLRSAIDGQALGAMEALVADHERAAEELITAHEQVVASVHEELTALAPFAGQAPSAELDARITAGLARSMGPFQAIDPATERRMEALQRAMALLASLGDRGPAAEAGPGEHHPSSSDPPPRDAEPSLNAVDAARALMEAPGVASALNWMRIAKETPPDLLLTLRNKLESHIWFKEEDPQVKLDLEAALRAANQLMEPPRERPRGRSRSGRGEAARTSRGGVDSLEEALAEAMRGATWPVAWGLERAARRTADPMGCLLDVVDCLARYVGALAAVAVREHGGKTEREKLVQALATTTPTGRLGLLGVHRELFGTGNGPFPELDFLASDPDVADLVASVGVLIDRQPRVGSLGGRVQELARTAARDLASLGPKLGLQLDPRGGPPLVGPASSVPNGPLAVRLRLADGGRSSTVAPLLRVRDGVPYVLDRARGRRLVLSSPAEGRPLRRSEPLRTALTAAARPSVRLCGSARQSSQAHIPELACAIGQAVGHHARRASLEAIEADGGGPVERFAAGYRRASGKRARVVMTEGDLAVRATHQDELDDADVLVFVGGGAGTEADHTFAVERGIPCVLVDGTGGVTDRLAVEPTILDRVVRPMPEDDHATAAAVIEAIEAILAE